VNWQVSGWGSGPGATIESLRAVHERVLASGAQQERLTEALLTLALSQRGFERREPVRRIPEGSGVLGVGDAVPRHGPARLLRGVLPPHPHGRAPHPALRRAPRRRNRPPGPLQHLYRWNVNDDRRRDFWGDAVIESWYSEATPVLDLNGRPQPVTGALIDESAIHIGADGLG